MPKQNGRRFAADILKCIFLNENFLEFQNEFIEVCSQGSN